MNEKQGSGKRVEGKKCKKGIDDELFEWELKMSQQSRSGDNLRKSMMEWASQPSDWPNTCAFD